MRWHRWKREFFITGLILGGVLLLLAIRSFSPHRSVDSKVPRGLSTRQGLEDFLNVYWQKPIPLQGPPPANYSELEASLRPEACGGCHTRQYADWKESLHSRAMGPGPWGQILDMTRDNPEEAVLCTTCHAPLSEQFPLVADAENQGGFKKNPHFDRELQLRGITCAACHVRQNRRFGPPKAEGDVANTYPKDMPDHGGFEATAYFERAEFCKGCHQFDPENSLLVNGKPLQDTYREWKNSIWGKGGAACQDCHMPQRRHLWRGIHDREWVKGGIQFKVKPPRLKASLAKTVLVDVEVVNSAVGHKFPTYTTPKVFLRASLLNSDDKELPGTLKQQAIGWDARFEDGEWKELFDTRIPPGESFRHSFEWAIPRNAAKIRVWMEVHPDHFYHVRFYPAYLTRTDLSAEGRKIMETALEESGKTPYILFEKLLPVAGFKEPRAATLRGSG